MGERAPAREALTVSRPGGRLEVLLEDSAKNLWIGTEDGLNRFDGYNFAIYRYNPDDPHSLRDDFVESIYEDRSGTIWIGTQSGWLERYDRENARFTHYQVSSHVYAILEDKDGVFWVGTKGPGLLRFDRDTGQTEIVWGGTDFTSIVEDQIGCPTFTRDVAQGIRRIWDSGTPGTYHLSAQGACSWFEFASQIQGVRCPIMARRSPWRRSQSAVQTSVHTDAHPTACKYFCIHPSIQFSLFSEILSIISVSL